MLPSATRVVVADAGPLIALGRLDLLTLLPRLFAQVQVPRAVWAECTARSDTPDVQRIEAALAGGMLELCDAQPISAPGLDAGESEAIGRALEIRACLLVDDLAARQHALAIGLVVIGTLGVLVQAKRKGLIPELRPLVERLRAGGQRLSQAVVAQVLSAAGESPAPDADG